MSGNRLRHEGLAETLVVCIPAGREHDALAGFNDKFLAANIHARACDNTRVANEADNLRIEQDRHLAFAQAVEEPADERIAHHDACPGLIFQVVEDISGKQLGGMMKILYHLKRAW